MSTRQSDIKIAVVGATGFLGRGLTEACRRVGYSVAAFTRERPYTSSARVHPAIADSDVIFWLATCINPQLAEDQPELVLVDRALFEAFLRMLQSAQVTATVVLASSGGTVYDPTGAPPYRETSPVNPVSKYGAAKLDLERILAAEAPGRHLSLRISNAYGPGQPVAVGQGVIAHWLRACSRGENIVLYGEPRSTRDYIFIDDIVAAMLALINTPVSTPILNIGSGSPTALGDLARTVLEVVGNADLAAVVSSARSYDVSQTWLDISLARTVMDWRPSVSLRAGVAEAWRYARDQGNAMS